MRFEELQAKAQISKDVDSSEDDELVCPITGELFEDPVICMDGHTYERTAIEAWLELHDTSPRTNLELESKMLIPNHQMRSLCNERRARLERERLAAASGISDDNPSEQADKMPQQADDTLLPPAPENAALSSSIPASPVATSDISGAGVCGDVTISQVEPAAACEDDWDSVEEKSWTDDKDVMLANEIARQLDADPAKLREEATAKAVAAGFSSSGFFMTSRSATTLANIKAWASAHGRMLDGVLGLYAKALAGVSGSAEAERQVFDISERIAKALGADAVRLRQEAERSAKTAGFSEGEVCTADEIKAWAQKSDLDVDLLKFLDKHHSGLGVALGKYAEALASGQVARSSLSCLPMPHGFFYPCSDAQR